MKWFKIYGEQWFMGSTRWELTAEQRAVWVDLLARASINDPAGQIDYYSLEQLASQFNVSLELLESTIKRSIEEKKIKSFPKTRKILIVNWKKYQSEYQRQLPYRKKDKSHSMVTKKDDKSYNKVTLREEEEEEERLEIEKKENKKDEKMEIHTIISHWNSKNIKNLEDRESSVMEKTIFKIESSLKDYSQDEILEAIDNYHSILKSNKHFFSYKWQLWEFLDRGLVNFLTKNDPFTNYYKEKNEIQETKSWAETRKEREEVEPF